MMVPRTAARLRTAMTALLAAGAMVACIDRPVSTVKPRTQSGVSEEIRNEAIDKVDLLLEVDNSGSMRENQTNIMAQFEPLINRLVNPPDANMDGRPDYPPVKDLHVGVISSDLGTPGANIIGCSNSDLGDDGLLNPIRQGQALQDHLPWAPRRGEAAPAGFRPDSCRDPNQFPAFITFCSGAAGPECDAPGSTRDSNEFVTNFRCNAGLYVNGCGLEQQLEAVWRAIVWHNPRNTAGNTDPNAGFLREDALLAILMLTDEEDMSVRDCRFARGAECTDALDVFQPMSTAWGSANLNLRSYLYTPGSPQDPTWPLERYVNPRDANAGWLALKPGHPERVVFAAITGVPLNIPTTMEAGETRIQWDRLLGAPDPADRENFNGRNTEEMAINEMSAEGPISMRVANQDPNCSERTVPACRREGSEYNAARPPCTTMDQYYAWPARRVVEIARRFDESPLCNGGPCHNGVVTSICSGDYGAAMRTIVEKIQARLGGRCLPRVLQTTPDAEANEIVDCIVRETQPAGVANCDAARGRVEVPEGIASDIMVGGESRHVCDIAQVATNPGTRQPVGGRQGWYYDRLVGMSGGGCAQAISFTEQALPGSGSVTRLECIQAVTGVEEGM